MALKTVITALAAANVAYGHFGLTSPQWRADTLSEENESKYSQWTYPCAGVPYGAGNTTDWPLDGGSLQLDLHHPWTYVFVNLGLGGNTTNFNVSLTPEFWNATGKGTLCVEQMPVPDGIADGTLASVQVVTLGDSGSALYNCADIRFSKDAKRLENCTSDGVTVAKVKEQTAGSNSSSNSTDKGGDATGADKGGGASAMFGVNGALLAAVVTLTTAFAMGLGI